MHIQFYIILQVPDLYFSYRDTAQDLLAEMNHKHSYSFASLLYICCQMQVSCLNLMRDINIIYPYFVMVFSS